MPRQSRIDAPGALHHIIVRGIERRKIFLDDQDRYNFLERLGGVVERTETICYAWALIPDHAHVLLRTGTVPIATVMRRLLTGLRLDTFTAAVSKAIKGGQKSQAKMGIAFKEVDKLRASRYPPLFIAPCIRGTPPWQGGLIPEHRRRIPGCHTAMPFASIGLGLGLDEL